jgi:hypothetical protein
MKTCKKCLVPKPFDRFSTFISRRGVKTLRGTCWECRSLQRRTTFEEQQAYRKTYNGANRPVKRQRDYERRQETKAVVDKLKDVPCADCGSRWPAVAMDFDHLGVKVKGIASMVSQSYKLELILEEIKGCEVVCACCHRLRTLSRKQNLTVVLSR